jgi:hypothetical protein
MHNAAIEKIADNTIDWENDTLQVRLYTSASNVANVTIDDATTLTNEVSNANGYTTGGDTVTGTVTRSTATTTLGIGTAEWNASSGNIVYRFAAIIDTTTTPDTVVAHCVADDTPADVTIVDGNPGSIVSTNGVATLARA